MSQEQKQSQKSAEDAPAAVDAETSDVASRKQALDADVDALLDEIDDVLETNAEEFVRSFVQKGGQ